MSDKTSDLRALVEQMRDKANKEHTARIASGTFVNHAMCPCGEGTQSQKGAACDLVGVAYRLLDALAEAEKNLDSAVMLSKGVSMVPLTELDQRWQGLVVEWGKRLERAQSAEARLSRLEGLGKHVVAWGEGVQRAIVEAWEKQGVPVVAKDPALDAFKAEINKEGV